MWQLLLMFCKLKNTNYILLMFQNIYVLKHKLNRENQVILLIFQIQKDAITLQ